MSQPGRCPRIGETSHWLILVWATVVPGLIGAGLDREPAARRVCGFVWVTGAVLAVNVKRLDHIDLDVWSPSSPARMRADAGGQDAGGEASSNRFREP